jgi:hypothetical protein
MRIPRTQNKEFHCPLKGDVEVNASTSNGSAAKRVRRMLSLLQRVKL